MNRLTLTITSFSSLAIALIMLSANASAEFSTVAEAHEVQLNHFQAPISANSSLTFKRCDDCDSETLPVSNATSYRVNNQLVSLQDFRNQVSQVRDREKTLVIVMQNMQSDTAVSVSVII